MSSDGGAGERLLGAQRGAQAGQRERQRAPAAAGGGEHEPHDLALGERLRAGQLVARVCAVGRAVERGEQAVGGVLGPERLRAGDPAPDQRHRGQQAEPLEPAQVAVARARRSGECASVVVGSGDSAIAAAASALARCIRIGWCGVAPSGVIHTKWRAPTRSAARRSRQAARPLSSSTVARGWSRAPPARCTTVSHAAQRVAPARRIGEVADRQLDPHALGPEAPRVAHEAAHRRPPLGQAPDHRVAQQSGGAGQQKHDRLQPMRRYGAMAYVIAEPCIGTKDNSCVEVCPVDCIHPTPDEPDYDKVEMLFIDPEECIDCDACVEACPVDACFAEDQLPEEWASFAEQERGVLRRPLGDARPAARVAASAARRARSRARADAVLGHRE